MPQFREWKRGDPMSADHLNEVPQFLNANGPVTAGPGMGVYGSSGMTAVGPLGRRALNGRVFLGQVVAQGPNGEADYPDDTPLYWVKCLYMQPSGDDTTEPTFATDTSCHGLVKDDPDPSDDRTSSSPQYINVVTVSNLAELTIDGNNEVANLVTGQLVWVWQAYERQTFVDSDAGDQPPDSNPVVRWVTYAVPQPDRWVTCTNSTGTNGDASAPSAATYTYDITDYFGGTTTLDTAVAVLMQRPKCKIKTATYGLARKTSTGDWKLLWVDEVPDIKKSTFVTDVSCDGEGGIVFNTADSYGFQ